MAGYIDPNDPVVQAFAQLGTTPVSDALDRLGLGGQVLGIKPIDREFTLCGRAHTVRNEPMTAGHKGESVGDYIDEVAPGGRRAQQEDGSARGGAAQRGCSERSFEKCTTNEGATRRL